MNNTTYTMITGSSSGIGKEIAHYCASLGMNILNVALPDSGLKEVNDDIIEKHKVKSDFLEVDLAGLNGPEEVYKWVSVNNYHVNFLVNNAGMAGTAVFEESSQKYINDRIMVNIRALALLTRFFIPLLKQHPESYILNVGSLSAFFSIPYKSLYSASKTFVVNFSRALKGELKNTNIHISVLCPNGVRTNFGTNARIDAHGLKGRLTALPVQKVAEIAVKNTLKKKFLIIPGIINYFLFILSKIIPLCLQAKILTGEFEKEVRVSKKE